MNRARDCLTCAAASCECIHVWRSVTLILPADTFVIAQNVPGRDADTQTEPDTNWERLADGRIQATLTPNELRVMLRTRRVLTTHGKGWVI